jgi:DNA-binding NarL/FixJ family response regulator
MIFSDGTALEIVPTLRKLYPDLKIMIFSMQLSEVYADAFKQYNIYYYLNKSQEEDKSLLYIQKFLNNEPAPVEDVGELVQKNPFSILAPRELEILHYLLNGHHTNDIANTLNLSTSTISTVKKRIFDKTETESITQLLELALLYNISF